MSEVFNRIEKKYLLNKEQYERITDLINKNMDKDKYGVYTITNLYLDTDNFDLIRKSIDKPKYKEKVRLRCYGVPNDEQEVFLEIKKKYKRHGNKRRIRLKLKDAYEYIDGKIDIDSQISREIRYLINLYDLKPMIYIAYDRIAYIGNDNVNFRLTMDYNIRSRIDDLYLENGDYGEYLLDKNQYLMEVKTSGSFPIWFVKILSDLKIYPISFSKYGNIYKKLKKEGRI